MPVLLENDIPATAVVERAESEGDDLSQMYMGIGQSYGGTSSTAGTLSPDAQKTYYRKYESGALSYIGRANYKYDNRYLAQFVMTLLPNSLLRTIGDFSLLDHWVGWHPKKVSLKIVY